MELLFPRFRTRMADWASVDYVTSAAATRSLGCSSCRAPAAYHASLGNISPRPFPPLLLLDDQHACPRQTFDRNLPDQQELCSPSGEHSRSISLSFGLFQPLRSKLIAHPIAVRLREQAHRCEPTTIHSRLRRLRKIRLPITSSPLRSRILSSTQCPASLTNSK